MKKNSFDEYSAVFFWSFKRMDNANYNFKVLEELYYVLKKSKKPTLLYKPIIVTLAAIVECMLYDLVRRINQHRSEKIPCLNFDSINSTRSKKLDLFNVILVHVKKYDLLHQGKAVKLYIRLEAIRAMRNRIHIQNDKNKLPADEEELWCDGNLKVAQETFLHVLAVLCDNYRRPSRDILNVDQLQLPWE